MFSSSSSTGGKRGLSHHNLTHFQQPPRGLECWPEQHHQYQAGDGGRQMGGGVPVCHSSNMADKTLSCCRNHHWRQLDSDSDNPIPINIDVSSSPGFRQDLFPAWGHQGLNLGPFAAKCVLVSTHSLNGEKQSRADSLKF